MSGVCQALRFDAPRTAPVALQCPRSGVSKQLIILISNAFVVKDPEFVVSKFKNSSLDLFTRRERLLLYSHSHRGFSPV